MAEECPNLSDDRILVKQFCMAPKMARSKAGSRSGQPLLTRCLWNFAHRFRCAAPIFLRAAADILRLFLLRIVVEFVDNPRSAEITLSSLFRSLFVWERSMRSAFMILAISVAI